MRKNNPQKRKHNWSNEGGKPQRMLKMSREKYFGFDLEDALENTTNQDNKKLIAATVINKASRIGIREAQEYVDRISGESLEPKIAEEIKRLLDRYSTYR